MCVCVVFVSVALHVSVCVCDQLYMYLYVSMCLYVFDVQVATQSFVGHGASFCACPIHRQCKIECMMC